MEQVADIFHNGRGESCLFDISTTMAGDDLAPCTAKALIHLPMDKMAAISQTTFLNSFS